MATVAESIGPHTQQNSAEGIEFGMSRTDCSEDCIRALLAIVEETREIPGCIAEVGSWKCGASIAMASANPSKAVYAFDLFGGLPYGKEAGFLNFANNDFEEVERAVHPYRNIFLIRGLHEHTIPVFAAARAPISLIFLDSDHYSSHVVTLSRLWPLLSPGGYVVYHDWTFECVQKAIREFVGDSRPLGKTNMGVSKK